MPIHEGAFLEPRDPSLTDSDLWPEFSLSNVKVTSQKDGQLVSLLSAHAGLPVRVSGQLEEVEDDLLSLVRDQRYLGRTIELEDVTTYSFAEFEDGTYGFYAPGKAGWFKIEGSASCYQFTYNEMVEATSMLYMMADKRKRARRKQPKMNTSENSKYMRRMFQDYLAQGRDPTRFAGVQDVREGFHEHRVFLITSMLEGQEGLDWNGTPMMIYFKQRFPEDFARIKSIIFQTPLAFESNKNDTRKRKSKSPHIKESQPKRRGRPSKESTVELPTTPVPRMANGSASSDDEDYGNPNVITRKRKSILRPSGGKSAKKAKKAAGHHKSLSALDETNNSDEESNDVEDKTPSAMESSITTIENGEHLDMITNPPGDRSSPDATPPPRFLPRRYLELKVVDYELPSTAPQGPGDLWTCAFEGCFHRVHQASTSDGKAWIQEHFKAHTGQAQEKIDLVLNESRPYLPVSNLVRRLQAFAPPPGNGPGPESIERRFSAPIRRKY